MSPAVLLGCSARCCGRVAFCWCFIPHSAMKHQQNGRGRPSECPRLEPVRYLDARYCSTTGPGIRPRDDNLILFRAAHSRTAFGSGPVAEPRRRLGVEPRSGLDAATYFLSAERRARALDLD